MRIRTPSINIMLYSCNNYAECCIPMQTLMSVLQALQTVNMTA